MIWWIEILPILYLVLTIFILTIWILLTIILIRVIRILRVVDEIVWYYDFIKELIWIYTKLPKSILNKFINKK